MRARSAIGAVVSPVAIGLVALMALAPCVLAFAQNGEETPRRKVTGRIGAEAEALPLFPDVSHASAVGSGATAVTTDRGFLFVVRDGLLYKVDESSLAVVATGRLTASSPDRRVRSGAPRSVRRRRSTSARPSGADR